MSSNELSPSVMNRREVLALGAKLGVGAGIAALTGGAEPQAESLYKLEIDEMMAATKPYITNEQIPRTVAAIHLGLPRQVLIVSTTILQ